MHWAWVSLYVFMGLWGLIILVDWLVELREERKQPFKFEVGETVIRAPAYSFQIPMIAMSRSHRRSMILKAKRNWLGRKVYKTQGLDHGYFATYREHQLTKNIESMEETLERNTAVHL